MKSMQLLNKLSMEPAEKRWLIGVICLQLLLITVPYLWAWGLTPSGMSYGGLLWTVEDHNVHLAWARQAFEGHFFIRDLFTNETITLGERPLFNNLFTFALGTLARWTHLPLIVVYHLLRVAFAALALWWFYVLCARFTTDRRIRIVALVLAAFTTGAGWLQFFVPAWSGRASPIDRPDFSGMMPEAFTFTSHFVFAIFAVSVFLLAFIYAQLLRTQNENSLRPAWGAALAALLLANIHTYDALPLNAILFVWAVVSWRRTRRKIDWQAPLAVAIASWPPVLYQIIVFLNSTEFRLKALMKTAPPPLWDILLSYGLLIPLACWGAWRLRRERSTLLLVLWAVVPIAMSYLPLSFGRKMMEGIHLPLCLLAGRDWCMSPRVSRRRCYGEPWWERWSQSAQFPPCTSSVGV
jgi:hypothetical protein